MRESTVQLLLDFVRRMRGGGNDLLRSAALRQMPNCCLTLQARVRSLLLRRRSRPGVATRSRLHPLLVLVAVVAAGQAQREQEQPGLARSRRAGCPRSSLPR